MRQLGNLRSVALALVLTMAAPLVFAIASPAAIAPASATSAAMADAAKRFLAGLTVDQRKRAQHDFADVDRQSLHFVPMVRSGIPIKMLTPVQRQLAHQLLRTGLSPGGYGKASQIMEMENVLAELEKNPVRRDPENYYFWIFGIPEASGSWGWKVEGHHLSLNFTLVRGQPVATAPTFFGSNPAEVRSGPLKGRRILHAEEDLGRALVTSLDAKARAQAIFDAQAPPDVVTFDRPEVGPLPALGLPVTAMTPAQKELLRQLLAEFTGNMPEALAAERLAKIEKAGFETLRFGWAGGIALGAPHYYRIQGPTFLIELDNTQDRANHVHSVWRDFAGDYGRDLLREHLKEAHGL